MNKLFTYKKGISTLLMAIEIIAALTVSLYVFPSIISKATEESIITKAGIAEDIALITDTLIAAPEGVVIFQYPESKAPSEYILRVDKNLVELYEEKKGQKFKVVRRRPVFVKHLQMEETLKNKEHLYFKKSGLHINVSSEVLGLETSDRIEITPADTFDPNWEENNILITPAAFNGSDFVIGKVIVNKINQKTNKQTAQLGKVAEADKTTDMLINFEIKKDIQNTMNVYIYPDSKHLSENKKLASLILKYLVGKDSKNIIKNKDIIISKYPYLFLNKADNAATIEISEDIKNGLGKKIVDTFPKIIEDYYS